MESKDSKVRVISLVSGCMSGILRTTVGHPFDTIKVLVQTSQKTTISYKSLNLRQLYRGIGPPMISMGLLTSLNFAVYENFRLSMLNYFPNPTRNQESFVFFMSATTSGLLLTFLTSPLDNLKVIQQTHSNASKNNLNLKSFVLGRSNFNPFRAITSNLIQSGFGRGFYISGYTESQRLASDLGYDKNSLVCKSICASCAGLCGWFFLFPFDVIRSNLMADYKKEKFSSTIDCFTKVYQKGGIKALYKGLNYTLIRAVPVAIASLVSYDYTQQFLLQKLNKERET